MFLLIKCTKRIRGTHDIGPVPVLAVWKDAACLLRPPFPGRIEPVLARMEPSPSITEQ